MKKIVTLFSAILLTFSVVSQTVSVGNRKYVLPNSIVNTPNINPSTGNYLLVGFNQLPTNIQRKQAEDLGIIWLDYLPKNTYLIYLQTTSQFQYLHNLNAQKWDYYKGIYKVSDPILYQQIPMFALAGDNIAQVYIQAQNNMNFQHFVNLLEVNGINNIEPLPTYHAVKTNIKITNLLTIANFDFISSITLIDAPSEPENLVGQTNHRSNAINTKFNSTRKYDGTGVVVAMGDDGIIGPHIDYQGRIDQSNVSSNNGDHGDHVAGTIMGAGNLDPIAHGMAPGAFLMVYRPWDATANSGSSYLTDSVRITSTSYSDGCNAGYTLKARNADITTRQNASLLHVFSAGNSNNTDCGYGAGNQWGNVTGGIKIGKNVIAVANLNALDGIASSSSRGPAHDGRLKPEISAVGTNVYSTIDVNTYGFKTGTSMSCPGVSGSFAQLYQAYKQIHQQEPDAGLMKAIVMNTADDIGVEGPDFIHGFGRINNRRALTIIEDHHFIIDSVSNNESKTYNLNIPVGAQKVNIMVYWTDKEGLVNAMPALVNNIDIKLTDPSQNSYLPWVLDHTPNATTLNNPAQRGIDSLNNQEQITLLTPINGIYNLEVFGKHIPFGPQKFYIVYEYLDEQLHVTYPIGGEGFVPGETEIIRWDAIPGSQSFSIEYSVDSGATWQTITSSANANSHSYSWVVPSGGSGKCFVRVNRGTQSGISTAPFAILGVPKNVHISYACPDSALLSWNIVPGAQFYRVSQLGTKYMDSIGVTTANSFKIKNLNPNNIYWFGVEANIHGVYGRRSIAIQKNPGTFGCPIGEDLEAVKFVYPVSGQIPTCLNDNSSSVKIMVKNTGINPISGFQLGYTKNNGSPVLETISQTINPGSSYVHTFSQTENFSVQSTQNFTGFIVLPTDGNKYNDSAYTKVRVVNSTTASFPLIENFDAFLNCGVTPNCGQTVCNLSSGWVNLSTSDGDNADWRTNIGSTASSGTGPTGDHTSGTGKYLYVEASECFNKTAIVRSPCIDLTGVQNPQLSFWFHMDGATMGELHVDILLAGEYVTDVILPMKGSYGSPWQQGIVNLSAFSGKKINVIFRAITGSDFTSDIAIDDIEITNANAAPNAYFNVSHQFGCVGETFTIVDNSSNAPNVFNWQIFPTDFQFVNGTTASSKNPEVVFTKAGSYSITLIAQNNFGTDTITRTNIVQVEAGSLPPIAQDFNNTSFPPTGWSVISSGGNFSWQFRFGVPGLNGSPSTTVFMNNFNYSNGGAEDHLVLEKVDLSSSIEAYFAFDVAYAMRNNGFFDGLRVDISTDCGNTWLATGYEKYGADLATASAISTIFTPTDSTQWRRDTINLQPYLGKSIQLRVVNINGNGNALYLDNINVYDFSPPVAGFVYTTPVCENQLVTFTQTSSGFQKTYLWNFGTHATPQIATTEGPHQVIFNGGTTQNIKLKVTNPLGVDSITQTINFAPKATANLSFVVNNDSITLLSLFPLDSSKWFIDSNIVVGNEVKYPYQLGNQLDVTLINYGPCNNDTLNEQIIYIGVETKKMLKPTYNLYPNPSKNMVTLTFSDELVVNEIFVTDFSGRKVWCPIFKTNNRFELETKNLKPGVYMVNLSTPNGLVPVNFTKID